MASPPTPDPAVVHGGERWLVSGQLERLLSSSSLGREDSTSPWPGSRGGDSDNKRIAAEDAGGARV